MRLIVAMLGMREIYTFSKLVTFFEHLLCARHYSHPSAGTNSFALPHSLVGGCYYFCFSGKEAEVAQDHTAVSDRARTWTLSLPCSSNGLCYLWRRDYTACCGMTQIFKMFSAFFSTYPYFLSIRPLFISSASWYLACRIFQDPKGTI